MPLIKSSAHSGPAVVPALWSVPRGQNRGSPQHPRLQVPSRTVCLTGDCPFSGHNATGPGTKHLPSLPCAQSTRPRPRPASLGGGVPVRAPCSAWPPPLRPSGRVPSSSPSGPRTPVPPARDETPRGGRCDRVDRSRHTSRGQRSRAGCPGCCAPPASTSCLPLKPSGKPLPRPRKSDLEAVTSETPHPGVHLRSIGKNSALSAQRPPWPRPPETPPSGANLNIPVRPPSAVKERGA